MFEELQKYGIGHVGFVVKDRDATKKQIEDLFGVKEWKVYEFRPGRAWSYGKEVPEYALKIAMGYTDGDASNVEVIEPLIGDGVHKRFVDETNGGGIHHIAFTVDNYDYWKEYCLKCGANVVFESETEDDVMGYRRCFYAEDTIIGTVYEVLEKGYFRNKK